MAGASKGNWNQTPKKPLGIFAGRQQVPEILNWREVSQLALRAALSTALTSGATVSFAPASGGNGVTVRVYKGDNADTAYSSDAHQLTELLCLITEQFHSSSEDVWQSFRIGAEKGERPA